MRVNRTTRVLLALAVAMGLAACSGQPLTTREKGTGVGALLGAGSGALVGAAVGHPAAGALIGGGVGATGGYLVGNALQNNEIAQQRTQAQVSHQQGQIESQRRQIQALQQTQETE